MITLLIFSSDTLLLYRPFFDLAIEDGFPLVTTHVSDRGPIQARVHITIIISLANIVVFDPPFPSNTDWAQRRLCRGHS